MKPAVKWFWKYQRRSLKLKKLATIYKKVAK